MTPSACRAAAAARPGVSMPKPISTGRGLWRRARAATARRGSVQRRSSSRSFVFLWWP